MSKTKSRIEHKKAKDDIKNKFDKKVDNFKDVADDKVTSTSAINDMKLEGTKDLVAKIKSITAMLSKRIDNLLNKNEQESKSLENIGKNEETELHNSKTSIDGDTKKIKDAGSKMNDTEARKLFNHAETEAEEDKVFLQNLNDERKRQREEYRNLVGKQVRRALSAQYTNFTKFGGFF